MSRSEAGREGPVQTPVRSRKLRRIGVIGLLVLGLGLAAAKLLTPSDIRPDAVKRGITPDATREARRLLALLTERYGGLDRYRQRGVTQVEYADEWASAFMRRVGSPSRQGEHLRFTFANGTDSSLPRQARPAASADLGRGALSTKSAHT